MVRKVVRYTVIGIIVFIVLLWFLGGGIQKIIKTGNSFHFLTFADLLNASSSLANFQLPYAPPTPTIAVSPVAMPGDQGYSASDQNAADHSAFANASPYAGKVYLEEAAARTQTANGEYVVIAAQGTDAPVDISGWSLESALSGVRAYIPQAAPQFSQGIINTVADVQLPPGAEALVVTGSSPVGVSFRENACTGYLGTLQPFTPALDRTCPAPLNAIPRTDASIARLGADCFAYLSQLPSCTFPAAPPPSLSNECRLQVQTSLSYNGCVYQFKNDASFKKNSWRLYLAQGAPLWGAEHEVIRLLDRQGQVVDVINY